MLESSENIMRSHCALMLMRCIVVHISWEWSLWIGSGYYVGQAWKNRQNGKLLAGKSCDWERKNKEIHKVNHPTLEGNLPFWREIFPSLQGNKHFFQAWIVGRPFLFNWCIHVKDDFTSDWACSEGLVTSLKRRHNRKLWWKCVGFSWMITKILHTYM